MPIFIDTGTNATGGPGFLRVKLWSPSLDQNPVLQDDSFWTKQDGNTGSSWVWCFVWGRRQRFASVYFCRSKRFFLGLQTAQKQIKNPYIILWTEYLHLFFLSSYLSSIYFPGFSKSFLLLEFYEFYRSSWVPSGMKRDVFLKFSEQCLQKWDKRH